MQGLLIAGRYRLADSIGSGGMGRVWRAHDEVLHRKVAIKELTAALYVSDSDQAVLLARTRAEARAAARINHSAVVTVHDVLEHDGRPWIVMELVEGHSLADAVKERGRVEPQEAARIGLWVLRALRAAHTAGVLHRDVKPGNVLLGTDRRVLLTDFGIAQIEGDSTITRTGEVVGSVDYLAPERVRGHDPGPASDLWALGATLYTAVEGRSPFRRTSPLSTMQAIVEEHVDEPRQAGSLEPVIAALLRKDPAQRPDAGEAERMLAEVAEGRRPGSAEAFIPTQTSGVRTGGTGTAGYGPPGHPTGGTAAGYPPGAGLPGTGATAVAAMPPVPAGGTAPARPRRRLRTLALVVAAAAVLGGGAAVAFQHWGGQEGPSGTGKGAGPAVTAPPASGSPGPDGTVPASWQRYDDEWGFSLYLPKGWSRKVVGVPGEIRQVDYTPDGGKHFVRIAIDSSPDFADAKSHQEDLEQQIQRLVDYRRVTMAENTYRDCKGSLWEYTWTALAKDPPYVAGPRHAVEETYFSRDGAEYAIYVSGPGEDWAQTSKQFKWVLQTWQQPR
ncbi:protein kinase [Streptomyces sp. SID486]|uniref:serine/threonine-protein kinase n=1 Tax=Streptomyces sp. SID486 TaxID=2690264 RepID=UPI001368C300|nr:serine/threonine-protein kinase [Streptomyces sp. SID486]MYX93632.1 protein kinase [Streptomyces sp. SID486]